MRLARMAIQLTNMNSWLSRITDTPPEEYKHCIPLLSPVAGRVESLNTTRDLPLMQGIWGCGVAISTRHSSCIAPFDGVIESIDIPSQRWQLKAKNGLRVMVQIGQPQQSLFGERLQLCAQEGEKIIAGEAFALFDPIWLRANIDDFYCAVTILNQKGITAIVPQKLGKNISTAETLLSIYL